MAIKRLSSKIMTDCNKGGLVLRMRGCGSLMVSSLVPGSSGLGSCAGQGHCVVFLGKTLNSHRVSLRQGVSMGTSKLLGKPNELRGSDLLQKPG